MGSIGTRDGLPPTDGGATGYVMASTAFSTARTAPPGHALGETIFRFACAAAATLLLAALAGVVISLFVGGLPAFRQFGFGFLTTTTWNPVTEVYGAAGPIVGTLITAFLALLVALPLALGVSIFLVEFCPVKLWPADRDRGRAARRHPLDRLRHVGPVRARPLVRQAYPAADRDERRARQLVATRSSSPARPTAPTSSPPR
jgi:hypothetical protein